MSSRSARRRMGIERRPSVYPDTAFMRGHPRGFASTSKSHRDAALSRGPLLRVAESFHADRGSVMEHIQLTLSCGHMVIRTAGRPAFFARCSEGCVAKPLT